MNLRTDWDGFITELDSRWPRGGTVYLARDSNLVLASAYDPEDRVIITTKTAEDWDSVRVQLGDRGHQVRIGIWSPQAEALTLEDLHIAAIAYESAERRPGLWVDAFSYRPTPGDAVSRLLEEFLEDGSIEAVDADLFMKIAKPNVVILGPEDIQAFLARNPAKEEAAPALSDEESSEEGG